MSTVLREFLDQNLDKIYPLTDESGARDNTNSFILPSSLITDIYLCAPNLPWVDKTQFYISNVLIRRYFIDVEISYDDAAVTRPLGTFKNINTEAPLQSTYDFIPSEFQSNDQYAPLYHMTGQIIIGDPAQSIQYLGSWSFSQADAEHSTKIVSTRVSLGLLNVQYISINGRLFTGNVRLREGSNLVMDVDTREVDGVEETVITFSATLNAGNILQLANDSDVLDALIAQYGRPIKTVNGLDPDTDRNFTFLPQDCTTIGQGGDHSVVVSNPCSVPCCDEDTNIENILTSIANLNLRYSQLKSFYDATSGTLDSLQNKLLVLGSEV